MSMRYKSYLKKALRAGAQGKTAGSAKELREAARDYNAAHPFEVPRENSSWTYEQRDIDGSACLVMRNKHADGSHALLYLYGSWMLEVPRDEFRICAQNIGIATQRDVWMPLYPLCTEEDVTVAEAAEMVLSTYSAMLDAYVPGNIAFYGFETGGQLALTVLGLNNARRSQLPMPQTVVAVSPAGCSADEREQHRMEQLGFSDLLVHPRLGQTLRGVMTQGREGFPEFLLSGRGIDCSGFPDTQIYYGTDECMSAKAELWDKQLAAAKVSYQINLARGMCHCYCRDIFFPESRQDYEEILTILTWQDPKR